MKIKTLLFSIIFSANLFAQSVEVLADLTTTKTAFTKACISDNAVFDVTDRDITVINLKTGKKVNKKIPELNSKYHNISMLRGIAPLMSVGHFEDDNCAFIVQSISKKNEVNISKVVIDLNLNVVSETLLANYPYETLEAYIGEMNRKLLFDEVSKNYAYAEFTFSLSKDNTYRVVLFNKEMEMTSNDVYTIDKTQLKMTAGGLTNINNSTTLVDDKLVFESKESIYSLHAKQFKTLINKGIKDNMYWKVASNNDKGLRIVVNDKSTNTLGLFDFNQNLKLVLENTYLCPDELFASEKSVWGKGIDIKSIKKCAFDIQKFYVDLSGNTNLVMALGIPYQYDVFNLTVLKFDSKFNLKEKAVFPISHQTFMNSKVINQNGFISIVCQDDGQWYDQNGNFASDNFPNKTAEKHALVLIQLSEKDFSKFTRTRIMLENQGKYKIDFNKRWLSYPNFQNDSNTQFINVVENEQNGFLSTAIYIGKLDLNSK